MNINQLPPELMDHIFGYLSKDERFIAARVCKLWWKIVFYGQTALDLNYKFKILLDYCYICTQSFSTFYKLLFESMPLLETIHIHRSNFSCKEIIASLAKCCRHLKRIVFHDIAFCEDCDFEALGQNCANLQWIEWRAEKDTLSLVLFQLIESCPSVTKLSLSTVEFDHHWHKKISNQIRVIEIEDVYHLELQKKLIGVSLLEYICKDMSVLEEISFADNMSWTPPIILNEDFPRLKNLRVFSFPYTDFLPETINHIIKSCSMLKRLEVGSNNWHSWNRQWNPAYFFSSCPTVVRPDLEVLGLCSLKSNELPGLVRLFPCLKRLTINSIVETSLEFLTSCLPSLEYIHIDNTYLKPLSSSFQQVEALAYDYILISVTKHLVNGNQSIRGSYRVVLSNTTVDIDEFTSVYASDSVYVKGSFPKTKLGILQSRVRSLQTDIKQFFDSVTRT